jgi:hypothetical protein
MVLVLICKTISGITLSIIFALFLPFSISYSFAQNVSSTDLYPMDSKPYGLSYEDHSINWNKFYLSKPIDINPTTDETGERCTFDQDFSNSSIFYLYGGHEGKTIRTCHIPSGIGLFIPLIDISVSTAEVPGATVDRLHAIAKADQDNVKSLQLKINNKEFSFDELKKYRTHTSDFEVNFPENAMFGANPGRSQVVADGHYVITTPLNPGNYTIHFGGSVICTGLDCFEPTFATSTIYNLVVG